MQYQLKEQHNLNCKLYCTIFSKCLMRDATCSPHMDACIYIRVVQSYAAHTCIILTGLICCSPTPATRLCGNVAGNDGMAQQSLFNLAK